MRVKGATFLSRRGRRFSGGRLSPLRKPGAAEDRLSEKVADELQRKGGIRGGGLVFCRRRTGRGCLLAGREGVHREETGFKSRGKETGARSKRERSLPSVDWEGRRFCLEGRRSLRVRLKLGWRKGGGGILEKAILCATGKCPASRKISNWGKPPKRKAPERGSKGKKT